MIRLLETDFNIVIKILAPVSPPAPAATEDLVEQIADILSGVGATGLAKIEALERRAA